MKEFIPILLIAGASIGVPHENRRDGDPTPFEEIGPLEVSEEAINHIVNHETGGKAYYSKFYRRPQNPGFSSGVTVGFGYDLRFHSPSEIRSDWAGVATTREIDAMVSVSGMKGWAYKRIRNKVDISWEQAKIVFERTTLPRWAKNTERAYDLHGLALHPHLNGSLVGNTFNRGGSMAAGDRRKEKRERKHYIATERWDLIPGTYEREQRHWPGHKRLQQRRREEGGLSRKALRFEWWQ